MIYEEKTELLRGGLFDVQNEVGLGRREEAYHQAFLAWLEGAAIACRSKAPHPLMLDGEVAHTLYPDFVAWEAITIELKAIPRRLHEEELVQIFDYLKCRGDRLGLLVNMGLDRVYVQRFVYEAPQHQLIEHWDYWTGQIEGDARRIGSLVREAILAVYRAHGTGYGSEVTGKLLQCALSQRRLAICSAPTAPALYRGQRVDESSLDCLVIDNRLLLVYTALFDGNQFNVSRGLSYLRALGLEWGVAVNFGKKVLEIAGLHHRP
jgi:GxxExxY protein